MNGATLHKCNPDTERVSTNGTQIPESKSKMGKNSESQKSAVKNQDKKIMTEGHEFANKFPLLDGKDYTDLRDDIKANGLMTPIVRYQDKILDGRNRKRVCDELGIEPIYEEYSGDDPLGYVLSMNLHRRHLNESQRAMIAEDLVNTRQGERTDLELSVNLPKVTQKAAAEKMKVSEKSVRNAKKVKEEGTAEQIEAVNAGRKSVNKAVKEIDQAKKADADESMETASSNSSETSDNDDGDRANALFDHVMNTLHEFSYDEMACFFDRMYVFMEDAGYIDGEDEASSDTESDKYDGDETEEEGDESDEWEEDDFDDSDLSIDTDEDA